MIYPKEIPPAKANHPEGIVYNALKRISDKYDIFFDRSFRGLSRDEQIDYQIDFIIAKPNHAILILEVKGGVIDYEGASDSWFQNGSEFDFDQAKQNKKNLVIRYNRLSKVIPFEWAFCFPESERDQKNRLPKSISDKNLIDRPELGFIEHKIDEIFKHIDQMYPPRKHPDRFREYERFKAAQVRDYGFVQTLGTQFKEENDRFVEITEHQKQAILQASNCDKLLVEGVAGSGKTIIAQAIAQSESENGNKVLFLCFNRTLANVVDTQLTIYPNCIVDTFHHYAETRIEAQEPGWFDSNIPDSNDSRLSTWFEEDVPLKFAEVQDQSPKYYDRIIIDEGQDFNSYWFDLVFNELNPKGKVIIFADFQQDLFGRFDNLPGADKMKTILLAENCRNTVQITRYINSTLDKNVINKYGIPDGEDVEEQSFDTFEELMSHMDDQIQDLVTNHKISTSEILIMLDSSPKSSQISNYNQVGAYDLQELPNDYSIEDNIIYYSNSYRFKGLDVPIVFVILEFPKKEGQRLAAQRYVQFSRARNKLYVYRLINH